MTTLPSHGVLLELHNMGIYLIGHSGIGKSEIALQLIHQGACLVCDDAPDFTSNVVSQDNENDKIHGQITGHCPKGYYGLMHLHDLGIINIIELFSSDASERQYFKPSQIVHFVIELIAVDNRQTIITKQSPQQLLTPGYQHWHCHSWTIPGIRIHLYPNRNIPMIINTAVLQFSTLFHKASFDNSREKKQ